MCVCVFAYVREYVVKGRISRSLEVVRQEKTQYYYMQHGGERALGVLCVHGSRICACASLTYARTCVLCAACAYARLWVCGCVRGISAHTVTVGCATLSLGPAVCVCVCVCGEEGEGGGV